MTEFDDTQHYGLFLTGTEITSETSKTLRQSELTTVAMRAMGMLDNVVDGTTPPTTDKLWLDTNTDPNVLKIWDVDLSAWRKVTFTDFFSDPEGSVLIRDTVAALKTSDLSVNSIAITRGYSTSDDGGAAVYLIKAAGTPDEKADHTMTNGRFAILQPESVLDVRQVGGAVADALAYARNNPGKVDLVRDGQMMYLNASAASTFHELRGGTQLGSDNSGLAIGPASQVTSTRCAQTLAYGKDHPLWMGLLFLTPVTDVIPIKAGARWEATETPPAVVEGHMVVRKFMLVDSGHDLVSGTGDVWSARTPRAPIHTLVDSLVAQNMAVFEPESNCIHILESDGDGHQEMWTKGANGKAGFKARSVDGFGDTSMVEFQFPAVGSEFMRFVLGGTELGRMQKNGALFLYGKTGSSFSTVGQEFQGGQHRLTNSSAPTQRHNRITTTGPIEEFNQNGNKTGGITNRDGNYIGLEVGRNGMIWTGGNGTPEGSITAPVGALYTREDGGAGTTLYVKESGTGNTGWVAK